MLFSTVKHYEFPCVWNGAIQIKLVCLINILQLSILFIQLSLLLLLPAVFHKFCITVCWEKWWHTLCLWFAQFYIGDQIHFLVFQILDLIFQSTEHIYIYRVWCSFFLAAHVFEIMHSHMWLIHIHILFLSEVPFRACHSKSAAST